MAENRQYDHEYKVQAVKLAKEIGQAKAAKELGIPKNTMYGWVRANRLGNLKSDKLRLPKNWESPRTPCIAGYGLTILAILTLELAHRPHKAL